MKHGRGTKRSYRDLCPDIEISRGGVVYSEKEKENQKGKDKRNRKRNV